MKIIIFSNNPTGRVGWSSRPCGQAAAGALQQLVGHFLRRIEGLQPGTALPWLLTGLLTPALQAEPASVEHQLEVAVAATVQVQAGWGVGWMTMGHGP